MIDKKMFLQIEKSRQKYKKALEWKRNKKNLNEEHPEKIFVDFLCDAFAEYFLQIFSEFFCTFFLQQFH